MMMAFSGGDSRTADCSDWRGVRVIVKNDSMLFYLTGVIDCFNVHYPLTNSPLN